MYIVLISPGGRFKKAETGTVANHFAKGLDYAPEKSATGCRVESGLSETGEGLDTGGTAGEWSEWTTVAWIVSRPRRGDVRILRHFKVSGLGLSRYFAI